MAIFGRIKGRIKEKIKKIKLRKKRLQRVSRKKPKKEVLQEFPKIETERTKFYTPQPLSVRQPLREDLPYAYGQDRIVLQVRDPWWIHAYWELKESTLERLRNELKDEFYQARRVLRIYDVSFINFDGKNAHRFFDVEINTYANNWYIDTASPGRSWCVDLGLRLPDGRFVTVIRSNVVTTPIEGPSSITDEEWMIPEDMFARLYGLGIGFGSSPLRVKKLWQERLRREISSGAISSLASPVKKVQERGFWLVVNTELIVYGATTPDAKVTVQGRHINLRPDGTFSLRFALPDGRQVIAVKAVSADNQEERRITPIVTKETR
ncbi:MAG: DUF4912 domain-containing protein [Candidatus Omnitrophica bacterium]|nr:DUF4912 domain-containing protein [Candidatus Omnitrophota bacterium]